MSQVTPAGRLHTVLTIANQHRQSSAAFTAWSGIFNVGDSTPEFFDRVTKLCNLVDEVRRLVESLPDTEDPELILRDYSQVERTIGNFARVATLNMSQFMEPLKDTGLLHVEMADRALRRTGYREPVLSAGTIDQLRDEVHDLISDVLGTDSLTPAEKRSIVTHLRTVEDTLKTSMLGGDDLSRANDGLIGAILSLPRRVMEEPIVRNVAKFAAAVGFAVTVNVATQTAENAISPPNPPSLIIIEHIANGQDLPAITSGSGHQDVVDAEVIEDGHGATG